MSNPQWLPYPPLPLLREQGRDVLVAPGCQQSLWDRDIRIHTCHTLFAHILANAHMHSALCTPSTTTSTSSGPFITPVAPLCRANGMAGLLILERDVVRRVEQRAKDGSLIDLGWVVLSWGGAGVEGCLVITGPCCCFSPLFIPVPHHILPFHTFHLLSAFCLSLSCAHCISISTVIYLLVSPTPPPPLYCWKILSL